MWRTFLFTAETGGVVYREIGWSHTPGLGLNLSGRALIAGGGDSLVAGQIYKVKVQLDLTVTGLGVVPFVVPGGLWAGATGNYRIEGVQIGTVDVNGNASGSRHLDPAYPGDVVVQTNSTALAAPQFLIGQLAGGDLAVAALVNDSYAPGSFTRTSSAKFTTLQANSTAIRSIQFRAFNSVNTGSLRLLFDSAQTKTSDQELTIGWRKTWGRVLVN
jgi:hypothetical protein